MNNIHFEKLESLYPEDLDGYRAAAMEGAEECRFTLDGQEVPLDGSD